jgi:hypothetical protein
MKVLYKIYRIMSSISLFFGIFGAIFSTGELIKYGGKFYFISAILFCLSTVVLYKILKEDWDK